MSDTPPELFTCSKRNLRLTAPDCACLWRGTQDDPPRPWEGRAACRTCTVGARNAGEPEDPFLAIRLELKSICPRCQRISDRIIGGRLCVSCYNRAREVRTGKNAKGAAPRRVAAQLRHLCVVVARDGAPEIEVHKNVTGPAEVLLAAARLATGPISVSWPSAAFPMPVEPIDPSEQAEEEPAR